MLINKTVDECIIETGFALFQCFVDENLSLAEKKQCIDWIILFLDYQDIFLKKNNQKTIQDYQAKLANNFTTSYYQEALKEFNTANLLYSNITSLACLKNMSLDHSTQATIDIVCHFNDAFIKTIKAYESYLPSYAKWYDIKTLSEDFWLLFYTIHYHIGYFFKQELMPIIKSFISLMHTSIYLNKDNSHIKITLIQLILGENRQFFEDIQPIQLINFIHNLDDIFLNPMRINQQIIKLIITKPNKIKCSMNMVFKKNGIKLQEILWTNNNVADAKVSNVIMHLFAYETYYLQGNYHYEIYEQLILKTVLQDQIYQNVFLEYKQLNKINQTTI